MTWTRSEGLEPQPPDLQIAHTALLSSRLTAWPARLPPIARVFRLCCAMLSGQSPARRITARGLLLTGSGSAMSVACLDRLRLLDELTFDRDLDLLADNHPAVQDGVEAKPEVLPVDLGGGAMGDPVWWGATICWYRRMCFPGLRLLCAWRRRATTGCAPRRPRVLRTPPGVGRGDLPERPVHSSHHAPHSGQPHEQAPKPKADYHAEHSHDQQVHLGRP